jgi:hypothetical protein
MDPNIRELCIRLLEHLYTVRFSDDFRMIVVAKPGMSDLTISCLTARDIADVDILVEWVKTREKQQR